MVVSVLPLLVLLVFVGIGGYLFVSGARQFLTVYHILRNDPVPVRELDGYSGPVEIEGTALVDEDAGTVGAPLTGRDCLCYTYEVEELRSSGKNSSWRTLDSGQGGVDFVVEDDTDRVRVNPQGADIELESHTITVDPGDELPDRLAEFVASSDAVDAQDQTVNLLVTELDVGNRQRFTERRLDPGEHVYVYGQARRGPAPEWGSGFVDAVISAGDTAPVFVISDTDERGTAWRFVKGGLFRVAFGLLTLGLVSLFVAGIVF